MRKYYQNKVEFSTFLIKLNNIYFVAKTVP